MASLVEENLLALRERFDADLVFEPVLLNTAGTVKRNYDKVHGDRLMLVHADNLSFFEINKFINAHENRPRESLLTMMVFRTDSPRDCGIVEIDDSGLVQAFHEKVQNPPGNLANGAVYIMEPEVIEMIHQMPGDVIDFSLQVLPRLMGNISVWENQSYHRDVGNPVSLLKAQWESPCNGTEVMSGYKNYFSGRRDILDRLALSIQTALLNETDFKTSIIDRADESFVFEKDKINIVKKAPKGFCSSNIKKKTGAIVYALSVE
jgi:ADP-glucose pyrophosphorylase